MGLFRTRLTPTTVATKILGLTPRGRRSPNEISKVGFNSGPTSVLQEPGRENLPRLPSSLNRYDARAEAKMRSTAPAGSAHKAAGFPHRWAEHDDGRHRLDQAQARKLTEFVKCGETKEKQFEKMMLLSREAGEELSAE